MEAPGSQRGEAQVHDRSDITIAIIGGNTVAGHALWLLLTRAGYETRILKAPPAGRENLPGVVDLLIVAPGLRNERREKIFAALKGSERKLCVPVLTFSSAIEERLFGEESTGATWPVDIGDLARAIEAALGAKVPIRPAIVASPFGEAALPYSGEQKP
jgi:hypothetical protein